MLPTNRLRESIVKKIILSPLILGDASSGVFGKVDPFLMTKLPQLFAATANNTIH